jgi:hypothetical protein
MFDLFTGMIIFSILTLNQYWSVHPECRTKNGTKCYVCGSGIIKNMGWICKSSRQ